MVQAINREVGPKRQTRRIISPQPAELGFGTRCEVHPYMTGTDWPMAYYERRGACWNSSDPLKCPWPPGTILYVKETWAANEIYDDFKPSEIPQDAQIIYRASNPDGATTWRTSRFMPKWMARTWLRVDRVKVERVNEISEEDAQAEGCPLECMTPTGNDNGSAIYGPGGFMALWNSIHDEPGTRWEDGPFVWAYQFSKIEKP